MSEVISSRTNSRVKALRRLVRQRDERLLVVEGLRLANELADTALPLAALVYTPAFAASPEGSRLLPRLRRLAPGSELVVSADVLDSLADTRTPQGVLAVAVPPQHGGQDAWLEACRTHRVSLALDGVADAGNVGTIWRTAAALAAGPLLLGAGSADPLAPKAVRASMGAAFWHPFWSVPHLPAWLRAAKDAGLHIVATAVAADGADPAPRPLPGYPFVPGTIAVIGSEAHGVCAEVLELADELLHIPLPGRAESLNAAVAAALVVYEAARSA